MYITILYIILLFIRLLLSSASLGSFGDLLIYYYIFIYLLIYY